MKTISNFILIFIISSCFVFNSTTKSSVIILSLLFVFLFLRFQFIKSDIKTKLPLIFSLLLCLPLSFLNEFNILQFIRLFQIIGLVLLFPIDFSPPKYFKSILFSILGYLIFIQIGITLDISFVRDFVDKFYPIDINYWGTFEYEEISEIASNLNNRLAGIYYNPNLMGQSILMLYSIILTLLQLEGNQRLVKFILFFLCLLSIVLSGSRTALITFIVLNLFAYRKYIFKYFLIFIPSALIGFIFLLEKFEVDIRILNNITDPFGDKYDSGGAKLKVFIEYFSNYNYSSITEFLFFLFGKMNWTIQFDADPGYIISFFGIFGFFILLTYLSIVYFKLKSNLNFVFFILMIGIGATVIMNFRFSILAFFALSLAYKKNKICVE